MDKATKQRIEELEARVRQLEARPIYVPVPQFVPQIIPRQPYTPTWTVSGSSMVAMNPAPDAAAPAPSPFRTFSITN